MYLAYKLKYAITFKILRNKKTYYTLCNRDIEMFLNSKLHYSKKHLLN